MKIIKKAFFVLLLLTIMSLQANSSDWLVKTFVIPNDSGWTKTELNYEEKGVIKKVIKSTSYNKADWTPYEITIFEYDNNKRLLKRQTYSLSDNNSILISCITNNYSQPTWSKQSIYSDLVSGIEIKENKSYVVNERMHQNLLWSKNGIANDEVKIEYQYDKDNLVEINYLNLHNHDTIMNYRLKYSKPSSKKHNIVWQTRVDGGWRDTLCTKLFFNETNQLISEIQYRVEQYNLIPLVRKDYSYNKLGIYDLSIINRWQGEYWEAINRQKYNYSDTGTMLNHSYQRYANNEWHPTSNLNYQYNTTGQCEMIEVNPLFWANHQNDFIKFIPLPENLNGYSIQASSIEFNYIDGISTDKDFVDSDNIDFRIFPNPSSDGLFYISNLTNLNASYDVYNYAGMHLKSGKLTHGLIDLSGHTPGLYLVIVNYQSKRIPFKLLIKPQ